MACSLIGIAGSIFMWKLRKIGFGLYVSGQLLLIVCGACLAVRAANLSWIYIADTLVSVLFIVLYSRCLKVLKGLKLTVRSDFRLLKGVTCGFPE